MVGVALGTGEAVGEGTGVFVGVAVFGDAVAVAFDSSSKLGFACRAAAPALWTLEFAFRLQADKILLTSRKNVTIKSSLLWVTIYALPDK